MKLPPAFAFCCLALCLSARAELGLLAVGDAVPDCALINEEGKAFHLREFKGQALALTFIFTRCAQPAFCPRMTERFQEAQRELAKAFPTGGWHLLSLSFDPDHDAPAQLSAYARAHAADPGRWTFATARAQGVRDFGALFGLTAFMEEGLLNHNLRTVVVDADGRVQCLLKSNEWTAQDLVWEMRKALAARR